MPTKSIKAQLVADFIVDQTPREEVLEKWEIFVDGVANKSGCGAEVVLKEPDNNKIEHELHFNFKASNNTKL